MKRNWRVFLWGLVAVTLVAGAGVASSGPTRTPVVVKFATVGLGPNYAAIILADKKGFFLEEGIRHETPRLSDPDLVRAVASGAVPFGIPEAGAAITAIERGAHIRIIAGITDRYPFDLVVKPNYTAVSDLRGKTLSIWSTAPGVALTLMKRVLAQGGLREGDYTIIGGGNSPARYAALVAGRIDGTIVTTPENTLAQKAGFRSLAQLHAIPALFAALIANKTWLDQNEAVMVAWLRAAIRGFRYVLDSKNETEVITVLSQELKGDPEVITAAYRQLFRHETYIVSWDLIPSQRSIEGVLEILAEINLIPRGASPAKYVDLKYVNQAARDLGKR